MKPIVTGDSWLGGGFGSIQTCMEQLIEGADKELVVLAYSLSDGGERVLDLVASRLRAGVQAMFVANLLDEQYGAVPHRLRILANKYPNLSLYDFSGGSSSGFLHAKVVIADRERAIVGSANLSFNGLVANHELAVYLEGVAVSDIAQAVDRLLEAPQLTKI